MPSWILYDSTHTYIIEKNPAPAAYIGRMLYPEPTLIVPVRCRPSTPCFHPAPAGKDPFLIARSLISLHIRREKIAYLTLPASLANLAGAASPILFQPASSSGPSPTAHPCLV